MISINQLSVDFGGFSLFDNISFLINPRDRIGLIGKNGAGKSTLLKIIAGQMMPTSGTVSKPGNFKIGYLPQHINVVDTKTIFEEAESAFYELKTIELNLDITHKELEYRDDYESDGYLDLIHRLSELNERYDILGGGSYKASIEQTLKGLGFEGDDFSRLTSELSGGWRMRVELAKILLQKPDVFLLDEPTNHLDIESIQWLEDFLKTYSGAVILISHDKAFLNNITTRTIEISLGKIYDYKASYDHFLVLRAERREQQLAAFRNQQKKIEDTEKFIERFRYKATKSVQVQSRIKQLNRMDRIEVDEIDTSGLRIKFPPAPHSGTIVVEGKHIKKSFGDLNVLDDVDFHIERGEKVAFIGRNGEGKTTMSRIIMSEIDHKGTLKLGHNVQIGYFAQNQAELLDENLTVLETIDYVAVGEIRTKIRDLLGAFLFSGDDVDKKVSVLSGGERTRLAMVQLLLKPVNFLILDEPTNHLDIRSKELLKQAIIDFAGTVLVVSHDREFLDGLVNKLFEFRKHKIKEHLGSVYDFLEKKKIESFADLQKGDSVVAEQKNEMNESESGQNKVSYEERKLLNKQVSKAQKNVLQAEQQVTSIETKIKELHHKVSLPENSANSDLFSELSKLEKKLEEKMYEWELLTGELEQLEIQRNNLV
ncbi:MAG: ABC-F family ATP-binding cassette domain-containing protein [Marinilabiliaceae bacterium]|nr:ABC-F family ATP-binding cassette domain-containing protein [Marinilabiliaceae bacterium]